MIGNSEFLIDNSEVVYSKQTLNIKVIDKPKVTYTAGENPNIGVIDLETFTDTDDINKVYAAGFRTNLVKEPIMYYLNGDITPTRLTLKLINELFRPVYNQTTFYCHNFGRYDSVYIINALLDHNDKCDRQEIIDTKYHMTYVFRDKAIIKISITKEVETKTSDKVPKPLGTRIAKLVICDSISLLNNSLDGLAKSYMVETQKGIFPYRFAKRSNLFYVGNTPAKSYFKSNIKQVQYNSIVDRN
jgi:DNA polymerase type B, organellar and viral